MTDNTFADDSPHLLECLLLLLRHTPHWREAWLSQDGVERHVRDEQRPRLHAGSAAAAARTAAAAAHAAPHAASDHGILVFA